MFGSLHVVAPANLSVLQVVQSDTEGRRKSSGGVLWPFLEVFGSLFSCRH